MNKTEFKPEQFQAYLFDMDGVLTKTAAVHAKCWKKMFDEFLEAYSAAKNIPFEPFTIESDYLHYVDGKPRYDGVRSFLESRSIALPEKSAGSEPSVTSLGDRKNEFIHEVLRNDGVEIFEGAIDFVKYLRGRDIRTAVVSSSKNCLAILEAGKIEDLFDARVDGAVAAELGLAGKPAPDMFTKAAELVGASSENAVVIEDAISGVQSGANGKFGLVIGVNHEGDFETLKKHGADFVIDDLGEFIP